MSLIGQGCKCGNIFSWLILISRKLDLKQAQCWPNPNCKPEYNVQFSGYILEKMVLTSAKDGAIIHLLLERLTALTYKRWRKPSSWVGIDCRVGPPVPIPNTEVKLICADNTWLVTAREDRSRQHKPHNFGCGVFLLYIRLGWKVGVFSYLFNID